MGLIQRIGTIINDAVTAVTSTWSSSKIDTEIKAAVPSDYVSDYWVSADIGNDSNNGKTEAKAFATLDKALLEVEANGGGAICILDDNEYTISTQTVTVPVVLIHPKATIKGTGGAVLSHEDTLDIKGYRVDGDDLQFQFTGSVGNTEHHHHWQLMTNPDTLYTNTGTAQTSIYDVFCQSVDCDSGSDKGQIIDLNAPARFHFTCNNITSRFTTAKSTFKMDGSGGTLNIICNNFDTVGPAGGYLVDVSGGVKCWIYGQCISNSGGNSYFRADGASTEMAVFGATPNFNEFTSVVESNGGRVYQHGMRDGTSFENLAAAAGLDLADLINVRDVSTGSQVSASLTQLAGLIGGSTLANKAGIVTSGTFALSGGVYKATVTFSAAFADAAYAPIITGSDVRNFTIESRVAGSFIINTNSAVAPTGDTYWTATKSGESS